MVRLDENYRLDSDGRYNWMLERRYVAGDDAKEPGKVTWKRVGYYPRLQQALSRYADLSLKEAVDELDDVDPHDFKGMVQGLCITIEQAAAKITAEA